MTKSNMQLSLLRSRTTRSASRTSCIPQRSLRASTLVDHFSLRCRYAKKIMLHFAGLSWGVDCLLFSGLLRPWRFSGLHFIPPSQFSTQSCKACIGGVGRYCELHARWPHRLYGALWKSQQSLAQAEIFCSLALLHKMCIPHMCLSLHGDVLPL